MLSGSTRLPPRLVSLWRLRFLHSRRRLTYWLSSGVMTPASKRRRLRGSAALLEDYGERRKFEASIKAPKPPPPAKSGADREGDVRQLLIDDGLVAETDIDEFRSMSMTDRFAHYALLSGRDGSWLHRVLSAFAHGLQWPIGGSARSSKSSKLPPATATSLSSPHVKAPLMEPRSWRFLRLSGPCSS